MRPLGHASIGARRIAMRARAAVLAHGEIAVFLSRTTREAAAVAYTDTDYAWARRRHAAHLVGTYRDDLSDNTGLLEQLIDDLIEHAKARKAAA